MSDLLIACARHKLYGLQFVIIVCLLGYSKTALPIRDKLAHGTMMCDPQGVKSVDQSVVRSVWNNARCVPSCATVNKMKDSVLLHEHEVKFNLLIELVGQLG